MSDQGWGSTTSYSYIQSPVLLEVEQPVVSNAECETAHRTIFEQLFNNNTFAELLPDYINTINDLLDFLDTPITEGMICAGGVVGEGVCAVNKLLKSIFDKTSNNKTTGRLWRFSDLQARETAHSHRCDKLGFLGLRRPYIWGIRAF